MAVIHSFKKKKRVSITFALMLIVLLAFAVMVFLSSFFMRGIIRKELKENAETALGSVQTSIRADLNEPRTLLGALSQTINGMIVQGDDAGMVYQYLKEINERVFPGGKELMAGLSSIYGCFDAFDGIFLDSMDRIPPPGYNPRERPWYTEAAARKGEFVLLQPYADIVTGTVLITYAHALIGPGERLLGVIAVDVYLDRIVGYLFDAFFGKSSYGILLNSQLEFLAHPEKALLGEALRDLNIDLAAIADDLEQGIPVSERRIKNYKGEKAISFFRQIENGWYLGVVTPEDAFYREVRRMRRILFALGAALAVMLITILLRIVAAKNRAEERMQIMFDATPFCANFWNSDYKNIDCNQEAVKFFEMSGKEEYLERFFELSPEYQPDGKLSSEKAVEFIKKAFEEGYCRFEWMHKKLNGELIPCEVIHVRVKYEGSFVVIGYMRDLRELKTAITQMRESKQSHDILTNVLNGLDAMIYVTVPDTGEILFINDLMKKHYGIEGNGVGQICYKILQAEMDEKCDFCPCFRLDSEPDSVVKWEEHNTLTKRMYRNTDRYIEWPDGRIAHIQHSVDVTELITARDLAERSSRFKSQFLSRMSHEIRTPMNSIMGIAEIQLQDETLAHVTKEAFGRIYNSGDMLLGIIKDILDLSKIETGKLELTNSKYGVTSLIYDIVQMNLMWHESKQVEFKLHVEETVPAELVGDELRIKQILNNLLSNAFKHTSEGTVNLYVSAEEAEKEKSGVTLVFRVSDTGQGMTAEQVSRLGDEYSSLNMEIDRETGGTGLALSITRKLIHLMNGGISIESELDKGSVFTVRLPQGIVPASGSIGSELAEKLGQLSLGSVLQIKKMQVQREFMPYGRVLVVDDVESNLYVARGLMAPYGLSIDTALSGFEAIDKIRDGSVYDVIFMDHMMPRMDGVETLKNIRSLGYVYPIVALTANALAGQADIFRNNGFDDFLSKPIDVRQLNEMLNKLVRDSHPQEVIEAARQQKNSLHAAGETPQSSSLDPRLAEIFTRDAEKALAILEEIYSNKCRKADDMQMFVINVHAMKSALENIGEPELSAAASKLEQAGRNLKTEQILSETPAFLNALRGVIKKIAPKEEDDINGVLDENADDVRSYLHEKLLVIQAAAEAFDKKTAKDTLAELRQKTWPRPIKELLGALAGHLLHSEFEETAEITADYILRSSMGE